MVMVPLIIDQSDIKSVITVAGEEQRGEESLFVPTPRLRVVERNATEKVEVSGNLWRKAK